MISFIIGMFCGAFLASSVVVFFMIWSEDRDRKKNKPIDNEEDDLK